MLVKDVFSLNWRCSFLCSEQACWDVFVGCCSVSWLCSLELLLTERSPSQSKVKMVPVND